MIARPRILRDETLTKAFAANVPARAVIPSRAVLLRPWFAGARGGVRGISLRSNPTAGTPLSCRQRRRRDSRKPGTQRSRVPTSGQTFMTSSHHAGFIPVILCVYRQISAATAGSRETRPDSVGLHLI